MDTQESVRGVGYEAVIDRLLERIPLSQWERSQLVKVGASVERNATGIYERWQTDFVKANGLPELSLAACTTLFNVAIVELPTYLRQHRPDHYLTQVLRPVIIDLYHLGIGCDYLMGIFHFWEKSLYRNIQAELPREARCQAILTLDHFFHLMILSSVTLYWQLESSREPLHPVILLSQRQKEVFLRLVQGKPTKEIAKELGVSPRTVETHRLQLRRKTGANSLAELIRFGIRSRWVT